ncbi:conserved hypothetical protein [Trichinella spiralis]|uniref:hypothetical protein n=1 Tax=Trichinella spiralis TaxID=6334 RepID=UPI0001EFE976|nr:conserved hypothetical protein [Trichinella spiralis]
MHAVDCACRCRLTEMSAGERKKNNKQGIEDKLRQKEENGRSEMAHLGSSTNFVDGINNTVLSSLLLSFLKCR